MTAKNINNITKESMVSCKNIKESIIKNYKALRTIFNRGHQTWSWRAGVLQSLAPTCLNTPAWKFQVYQARPWLSGSGVFN